MIGQELVSRKIKENKQKMKLKTAQNRKSAHPLVPATTLRLLAQRAFPTIDCCYELSIVSVFCLDLCFMSRALLSEIGKDRKDLSF